jgi:hypothetical protein
MFTKSFIGIAVVSIGASLFGCNESRKAGLAGGAIQLSVSPAYGASPHRTYGNFSVRGIDNGYVMQVPVAGDSYRSLRLPVPAGAYWLQWQAEELRDLVEPLAAAVASGPHMLVVAPAGVTRVDVRLQMQARGGALIAAIAAHELEH